MPEPKTNTTALAKMVTHHPLLTESQKYSVVQALYTLDTNQLTQLEQLLTRGTQDTITTMTQDVVCSAASAGAYDELATLDQFFTEATRTLRHSEEAAERSEDDIAADQLLNTA